MALFCLAISPIYFSAVAWWQAQGYSDETFFMAGTGGIHLVMYVGMNGFFHLCDTYGYLEDYKLYRNEAMAYSDAVFKDTLK
jgi:hypothetical protein